MAVLMLMGMRSTAKVFEFTTTVIFEYYCIMMACSCHGDEDRKPVSKYIFSGFKLNPCVPCGWIQWKSTDCIMSSVELVMGLPDWSVWTPQWPGRYQDDRAAFHHGWPPDEPYHGIRSTRTVFATFTTKNYNNTCFFLSRLHCRWLNT